MSHADSHRQHWSQKVSLFVPHSKSSYAAGDTADMKVADGFVGWTKVFKYMASSVSSSLSDHGEVDLRIKAAGALHVFGKCRKPLGQHRNIPFSCKKLAYEPPGHHLSEALYGCAGQTSKVYRKSTRKMCRVTTEHI
jgi:hypothetical protein